MTITIYGAGAIGGLTGACLARAGEDVLLVDKVAELGDVWVGELDGRFTERLDRIRGLLSLARARPHARLRDGPRMVND